MGNYSTGFSPTNPLIARFLQAGLDRNLDANNHTELDTYNLEAQHTVELANLLKLTYGANYRHNAFSTNLISHFGREDRFGMYVQGEWRFHPKFTAVASVRYDLDTFIEPTTSPRIALLSIVPGKITRFA
jgi:iron complex outermembrane receptor protein